MKIRALLLIVIHFLLVDITIAQEKEKIQDPIGPVISDSELRDDFGIQSKSTAPSNHLSSYTQHTNVEDRLSKIVYTIKFQNIGDRMATNIRVIDTLDTNISPNYVKVKATSHPNYYSLSVENNVLIWSFNGINLPDSSTEPEASKGFICYEISLKSAFMNEEDYQKNRADVFFEYDPLGFNEDSTLYFYAEAIVDTDIISESESNFLVYPNPFDTRIQIKNPSDRLHEVSLFSFSGEKIASMEVSPNNKASIDTQDLSSGTYYLREREGFAAKIIKK